jgi:uncharacterized phage-associated protein
MASTLHRDKYLNALLYFIAECGNEKLGLMKLNKLFYYLDFISYRDRGETVTGETYVHLPKGPYAAVLEKTIIPSAQKEGNIDHREDESDTFGKRNRYQALQPYDLSVFDNYEKVLLSKIAKKFCDWTTSEMIAQTHTEAPWVFSEPLKALDYKNARDIEFFVDAPVKA